MSLADSGKIVRDRGLMAAVGAAAGLAVWLLVDVLNEVMLNERLYLAVLAFSATFLVGLMGMTGPLRLRHAAPRAAGLGLLVAGLLVWASLRHATIDGFLDSGWPLLAAGGLTSIALPFLIAQAQRGPDWRDYPTLFTEAWNIAVRYAAAWLFVGVVWALIMLSDALFQLVGLEVIDILIDMAPVPFVLTGLALGLALAVVDELAETVSPFLVLRLLRLLVPVVLVVVAVFLLALPFRGLSNLFGAFSAATVLLAMSVGIATLVTTAVDQSDAEAVTAGPMRRAAQALALMLPLLAGLAVAAVWLRVAQYGWTPARLAAASASAVMLGYGLLYAAGVLRRSGWMARVRQANVTMALVLAGLAVLWLSPVLNAERLAAQSQLARYRAGAIAEHQLDLWAMAHDWGRPGQRAVAALRGLATAGDRPALQITLDRLDASGSRYDFAQGEQAAESRSLEQDLAAVLPILPAGNAAILAGVVAASYPGEMRDWIAACQTRTAAGNPACALVVGDFWLDAAGPEAILFWRSGPDYLQQAAFSPEPDGTTRRAATTLIGGAEIGPGQGDAILDALQAGQFSLAPAGINALSVAGRELVLSP